MAIRERVRQIIGRDSSANSSTSTASSESNPLGLTLAASNLSTATKSSTKSRIRSWRKKPEVVEAMPTPRYGPRYTPKHHETLHAFSWANLDDRRSSAVSGISPRNSWVGSRRSTSLRRHARKQSSISESRRPHLQTVPSGSGDEGDVGNVGLSRRVTTTETIPDSIDTNSSHFSAEDLDRALSDPSLKPRLS